MDHKMYKIFDVDDFERVTRGIKVAQCMRTDSTAGPTLDSCTILSQLDELSVSDKLYCSYCACSFDSQQQQRQHYKLDWHRYNLKQSLVDKRAVTEENFAQLADHDDVSSISGSDSDSEVEEEDDDESDPSTLKPRLVDSVESSDDEAPSKSVEKSNAARLMATRHTKVFFENQDGRIVSVHRCLLHGKKAPLEKDEDFVATALKCVERTKWAIFMLGGGHFAAAIFDGREVLQHKTFHSYTVRKGQGGTQSSRDNRSGGSHPKSAGASLRRYNEAALIQHVQDITASWSDDLAACDLVFYRASGGNMAVLFGGRNPPLAKKDPRLRTIPFPTRRATFSEVKRVHDVLASLESYGMAEAYQSSFPQSPRKKLFPKSTELETSNDSESTAPRSNEPNPAENNSDSSPQVRSPRQRPDRAKSRETVERSLPSIVKKLAEDSSESSGDPDDANVVDTSFMSHEDVTMNFARDLSEYGDTVPHWAKNKKRKKPRVRKAKAKEDEVKPVILKLSKQLMLACQKGDITVLKSVVNSINLNNSFLSQHSEVNQGDNINSSESFGTGVSKDIAKELGNEGSKEDVKDIAKKLSIKGSKEDVKDIADKEKTEGVDVVSSEDFLTCLNRPVDSQDNTVLHIASSENQMDIVRYLMEVGSNPSTRNKKGQSPYVVATTKEMRNLFRRFLAEFPDKFDYTKSMIPGGLTDEMEQEQAEKRRALKKAKRDREKEKKKEDEAKKEEAQEKERFLKLTDREKRALAAERRLLSAATTAGVAAPVVARCFLCAVDMTGKVPFEYDIHWFCSITCLKAHRMSRKTTL